MSELVGGSDIDVFGYLARLGLEAEQPSLAALERLHAAHVERVPYEVLDVQLGEPAPLEPRASVARIVQGRGGSCYNLNGAFSALLEALGYQVIRRVGGVQHSGAAEPERQPPDIDGHVLAGGSGSGVVGGRRTG